MTASFDAQDDGLFLRLRMTASFDAQDDSIY
jgi:hypothetical protein